MIDFIYFWTKHLNIYFTLLGSLEKEVIFCLLVDCLMLLKPLQLGC